MVAFRTAVRGSGPPLLVVTSRPAISPYEGRGYAILPPTQPGATRLTSPLQGGGSDTKSRWWELRARRASSAATKRRSGFCDGFPLALPHLSGGRLSS